jgi:hypothetical protein
MVGAAVLDTVLRYVVLTRSGRVGQAVLLTLRRPVLGTCSSCRSPAKCDIARELYRRLETPRTTA